MLFRSWCLGCEVGGGLFDGYCGWVYIFGETTRLGLGVGETIKMLEIAYSHNHDFLAHLLENQIHDWKSITRKMERKIINYAQFLDFSLIISRDINNHLSINPPSQREPPKPPQKTNTNQQC